MCYLKQIKTYICQPEIYRTSKLLSEANKNIYLSTRNLQNIEVVTTSDLCTYKIMRAKKIVLAESSVAKLEELFKINA